MKFVLCTLRSGLSGRSVVAAVRMNTFPEEEHNEEEEVEWGLPPGPPPEIRVPFGQKTRREFGERIFDNRETICITVIAYLVVAILLLTSRVLLAPRERESAIVGRKAAKRKAPAETDACALERKTGLKPATPSLEG